MSVYQPLKVTAELLSPIILDRQQPLDGVLGAVVIQDPEFRQRVREYRRWRRAVAKYGENDSRQFFANKGWFMPRPEEPTHFLPLGTFGHGIQHKLWVYCSSWAIPEGETAQGMEYFNKRLNLLQLSDWLEPSKRRIEMRKGRFKSQHIPFIYTVTEKLAWYVLAWREQLEEILSVIFAIGKKRQRGYGNIRNWGVETIDTDKSVISPEREIMRPIPATLLSRMGIQGSFNYAFTSYRPPYWQGKFVERCAVEGRVIA